MYKENTLVKITDNINQHEFQLEEIVKLEKYDKDSDEYLAVSIDNNSYWYIQDSEFELLV